MLFRKAMKEILNTLISGQPLHTSQMQEAFEAILNGESTAEETGAFLMGLSQRGETAQEIAVAAKILRSKARTISAPPDAVDCCGTGGDASGTYNISTAVALVSAACGVPVAKHGNRAASSKSGAADVLEALGVNLNAPANILEDALRQINFAFLMAPHHHQVLKPVAQIRKNLGVRTIFNLLGPLANPAGTKIQLLGVFTSKWTMPMAQALRELGSQRAWVVHGRDGLDEITLCDKTDVAILHDDGRIEHRIIGPEDFGLPAAHPEDLKGGDIAMNAAALKALLMGEHSAYRNIVLANTAAVLTLHDPKMTLIDGVKKAAEHIDNKSALNILEQYVRITNA